MNRLQRSVISLNIKNGFSISKSAFIFSGNNGKVMRSFIVACVMLLISSIIFSQTTPTYTTPGTFSFTVPAAVTAEACGSSEALTTFNNWSGSTLQPYFVTIAGITCNHCNTQLSIGNNKPAAFAKLEILRFIQFNIAIRVQRKLSLPISVVCDTNLG